jgi:alanine dehydrogenase
MAYLLFEEDVRFLLSMKQALEAIEDAFRSLAAGEAVNFPRQRCAAPGIAINVLCSVSHKLDAAGLKTYPIVRTDVTVGSSFTFLVYRVSTGALIGVMEANTLGQIRTGATSGVAARYLARPNSRVMTLFGAGWQAESQAAAISCALPGLQRINVVGRSAKRTQQFCEQMRERLRIEVEVAPNVEQAVRDADIITTATGSHQPVFDGRWIKPGTHINAVGSNLAEKQEIDATSVARATRIFVDDWDVARSESGDLIAADTQLGLDWNSVHPLSSLVGNLLPGRKTPEDITLFESHGMGLEDLAAACCVLEQARRYGVGKQVPLH